jgi:hypothetical protein
MNNEMDKCVKKLFWICGLVARLYFCIHPARRRKTLINHKQMKRCPTNVLMSHNSELYVAVRTKYHQVHRVTTIKKNCVF